MSTRESANNNDADTEIGLGNAEMTTDILQLSDNHDGSWLRTPNFYATYGASKIRQTYFSIKTWSQDYNNKCKILLFFNIMCFVAILGAVTQFQPSKNISKLKNNGN